jgi:hypothetical protein
MNHEALGAIDEALNRFEQVIAIDPNDGVATRRFHDLAIRRRG